MSQRSFTIASGLSIGLALVLGAGPRRAHAAETTAAGTTSPVSEGDRAAALALVREGNRLLDKGQPAVALERFRTAHQLVGGDKLRFNIGQALAALPGREREAYQELGEFLSRIATPAPDLARAAHKELERLHAKLAFLTLAVKPEGAAVVIDGDPVGRAPLDKPLILAPGSHALDLTATGCAPYHATLILGAGQERSDSVALPPPTNSSPPAQRALTNSSPPPTNSLAPAQRALTNSSPPPTNSLAPAQRALASSSPPLTNSSPPAQRALASSSPPPNNSSPPAQRALASSSPPPTNSSPSPREAGRGRGEGPALALAAPAPALVVRSDQPRPPPPAVSTPLYRRWWFWAGVGAVVLGGAAAAIAATRGGGTATHACPSDIPPGQCLSFP